MELEGGVAIVTGSSSGIGATIALRLAGRGCNVVINHTKSEAAAEAVAAECEAAGAAAMVVRADVADDADCRRLVAAVERWGRLDVLVNNAGITRFVPPHDLDGLSGDDFVDVYAVNLVGKYQAIRAAAPHLKTAHGCVVNISSTAGVTGVGSSLAYSTSMAGINVMTLALARALAPEIRVNGVCPGMVDTDWHRKGLGDERYEQARASYEDAVPLGRVTTAEDVAGTVLWLIADAGSVTGEIVMVDAGLHLGFAPLLPR